MKLQPRRILIALLYVFVVAAVLIGTFALVEIGRGYSYDFKSNRFVLNGLVILGSNPSGATIYQGEKTTRHKTPYRVTLEAGDYLFSMTRAGYRSWSKRLHVSPSEVTYAQYAILLPDNLKVDVAPNAPLASQFLAAKDHRQLALISLTDPAVWVYPLDGRTPYKVFSPRAATAGLPLEVIDDVKWSDDASHLLVRTHVGANVYYWLTSNAGSPTTTNLTDLFKFDFKSLRFNPLNWRELYWTSPEGLRRINAEAQTSSAVLAENVTSFAFGADRVFYVQATATTHSLWALDRSDHRQQLVQALPASDSYEIAYAKYRDRDALAVLPTQTRTASVYWDIFTANIISKQLRTDVDHILFNGDGRYLAYYNDKAFGSYDLEKNILEWDDQLVGPLAGLNWYDNYHLLLAAGSQAGLVEYDGANFGQLSDSFDARAAILASGDGRRVYFLNSKADQAGKLMVAEIRK